MTTYSVVNVAEARVNDVVRQQFPEDEVGVDVTLTHWPSDNQGLLPVMVIYLQINGTEKVDGLYLSEVLPPSDANNETIREIVERLAALSAERRGEIRASLARGDSRAERALPLPAERV